MSFRTGRRMNDGNYSGMKQDRYRNSDFDYRQDQEWRGNEDDIHFGGVSRVTPNTMGVGRYNENRGRRGDQLREDNPFENGDLSSWAQRKGWDQYFDRQFDSGNRQGGALINNERTGNHRGRGPRGYRRPDNRIYEDVCETLSRSPDVDASEIEVSVKEGVVYLNGSVSDRATKRAAELEAERVSGVLDVQNLLSISRNSGSNREEGTANRNNTGEAQLS